MKQVIGIVTHRENYEMFSNLLKSLKGCKYDIVVVLNDAQNTSKGFIEKRYLSKPYKVILNYGDGFELGALKRILEETDYDEIFLLQDSCQIKDLKLFDMMFDNPNSVAISDTFLSYLGKYKREILEKMDIPETKTKTESVRQEWHFNHDYMSRCKVDILFGQFGFTYYKGNRFEEKFGRNNLISENDYLIKYKGTWSAEMIKD